MVRLGGRLLLLHQFRQHEIQRRHQADHVQLHAVHLRRGDVLPAEPNPDDSALQWIVTILTRLAMLLIVFANVPISNFICIALLYCSVLFD